MLLFLAAALGVYVGIVYRGLTPTRAFWLSTFAVLSISSKEITAFVFIPCYIGLAWSGWKATRNHPEQTVAFWRSVAVGLLTGVLGYALLNIVYAPGCGGSKYYTGRSGRGSRRRYGQPHHGVSKCSISSRLHSPISGREG